MNIERFREECLALPYVTEDMPFDDTAIVFRLKGKIFACVSTERPNIGVMKCDAEYALELRARYLAIEGAWHWNKKYWNQVDMTCGGVTDELIVSLIKHAYQEVNKKLPKIDRVEVF